ncbi:platelet-derived growth factor receptor beta-like isoform X2 [Genypterus blacodes]|uniref:platelet-derived growth factor receptor beta-like isoform X2 n=1 Tax=Genypterus blacodes TaxID=154954 RepID=UPI003F76012C
MTASIRGQTGLCVSLLLVLLSGPEAGVSLEFLPSVSEVLLNSKSNFSVVCSGSSRVSWRLPQDSSLDGLVLDNRGSSSILQIYNATWRHSGKYVCEEESSDRSRDIDIFVQGRGPDEWFVPTGAGPVMKVGEEGTIPCIVSDPHLNVTLYERPDRTPVTMVTFEPGRGFTGRLNDTSYVCVASHGAEERESRVYYVFSIVVAKAMLVELLVSGSVLRQGDMLTVNCTVKDSEMVYFSWTFPRRQEFEPLMEFLPDQIRSFVNISMATLADSGVYVCSVQDTVQRHQVQKNVTVTVLERGYVRLYPSSETNVSSLLHEMVELSVEVDAHPTPTVLWTKDNQTIAMETMSVTTTHLVNTRYVSKLMLAGVQMQQTGSYTLTASNDDEVREVIFNLEVKAPPRITSLSEFSSQAVLCVSEGAPPPKITWYTCHSSHRCRNLTDSWQSQSAASEGVALQENITYIQDKAVSQVRSLLTLNSLSSLTAVRCESRNAAGRRAWDLRLLQRSLLSQVAVLAAVLVLVIVAVIFLIVLIFLWRKKPQYEAGWKVMDSVSPDGQQYSYVDSAHLPYNSACEIPRDHVVLGQVLGSGSFGRVVEATISHLPHRPSTKVTVKMLKSHCGSLMSELKVLLHLGPHLNVVNLLGACTRNRPVYLITEFCHYGDLVNYLQRNKHTFFQSDKQAKSDSDGGYMDMNTDYVAMKELSCGDIEAGVYESTQSDQQGEPTVLLCDSPLLSLHDLFSFSFQVAQAMDFLSSRNCVHRDLAARNVLVCEGKLVKVGDFSLARDLRRDEDYVARSNAFVPVRWMSPESLYHRVYSCQSDVWAYGVLLWEIFSLGMSPYPDVPMTQDFCSALKRGHRMSRPDHAPLHIYELMQRCWEDKPQNRPTFASLVVSVGDMLSDAFKQRYFQLTQNFTSGEKATELRPKAAEGDELTDTHGSHSPQISVDQSEVETQEAGPSHSTYVVPITIETNRLSALDAANQDTTNQDAVSFAPPMDSHNAPGVQEMTSSEPGQEEGVEPKSAEVEEEESCL